MSVIAALLVAGLALLWWRPLAAWWGDDAGNRALARGQNIRARGWFDWSLGLEPAWSLLHEDRGRVLAQTNPVEALAEFDQARCGPPCDAEAGDALVRLGRLDEAIDRYIRARATTRVTGIALELAQEGRYDAAMALVHDFIGRLHQGFLERADMASAYATLGSIQLEAAASRPAAARALRTQAINSYAQASNLAPLNEGYLLSYAFAQMRWGDAAGARRAFDRLLEIHPHQPDAEAALSRLASPYRRSGSGAPLR